MYSSTTTTTTATRRRPLYPRGWGSGNVAYVGTFRAFSMAVLGRSSLEIGDKIILPPEALQSINRLCLPFPIIFQVRKFQKLSSNILSQNEVINQYKRRIENIYRSTNPTKLNKIDKWLKKYRNNPHDLYTKICETYGILPKSEIMYNPNMKIANKSSKNNGKQKSFGKQYCGVYEFSSPRSDTAYLPHWMIQNLGIDEGDKIELQSQFNIKKGIYCKLQPFKQEFMDKVATIGYKSTLEHSLRHYSVLSNNQRIVVEFNHYPYECIVKQTKPGNVISILGSTDLEIEFEEPLKSNINNDNNTEINDIDDMSERDESSSLCLSDFDNGYDSVITKCEIDGALLKKLGVPLDYNEQTDLAMMIIENRKLLQENQNRFDKKQRDQQNYIDNNNDDDDDEDDMNEEEEEEKEEEKEEIICDERLSPIGPNDVKCTNCGKYVHSMSIAMHEVHCNREYFRCKQCNECIKKKNENEHFELYHREIICICNDSCIGKIKYDLHTLSECKLRLIKCDYCKKTNIAAIDYQQHRIECGEQNVICNICNKSYILKNKSNHDCGTICILCGQRIADSKDKLLHLVTSCKERRAICNYCGVFRTCYDMEQHRKFCGSRSEKCEKCMQFVSLMNMEPHLQSNCQWFNNNQLSSKKRDNQCDSHSVQEKLQSLNLKNDNNDTDQSLFGLLKSNHSPTMIGIDNDDIIINKEICPHCPNDDRFLDREEFEIHIATKHPKLVNNSLTQTIMASFNNPDILKKTKKTTKTKKLNKKKKKRKLSSDIISSSSSSIRKKEKRMIENRKRSNSDNIKKYQSKTQKWHCHVCTFTNTSAKRRCLMCQTPRI